MTEHHTSEPDLPITTLIEIFRRSGITALHVLVDLSDDSDEISVDTRPIDHSPQPRRKLQIRHNPKQ